MEAEVAEYMERFDEDGGVDGERLVVRDGRAQERKVNIGPGTVSIPAPQVNDKRVDEVTAAVQLEDPAGVCPPIAEEQLSLANATCRSGGGGRR